MRVYLIILLFASFFSFGNGQDAYKKTTLERFSVEQSPLANKVETDFLGKSSLHASITVESEYLIVEEIFNNDDVSNSFFSLKLSATKKNFPSLPVIVIIKDSAKGLKNEQPFYGYSQPIYISQQVLRI
ncbi:hypothetical protein [Flavobacterium sp.]|uniref:hypothetical protein n=1 Tax=Flavobacterium sp. TaxID=239 RepID=UPI002609A74A|nr:hypothetical protein [Flavobacterium sp.]MDG2432070.1 hypothetical protein [Flavobacterium sp.]